MSYKGMLSGFPNEVVEKMLERQAEQGNVRDLRVFEKNKCADRYEGGFQWFNTIEGSNWWSDVIFGDFDSFFQRYPKEKKSLEKVYKKSLEKVYKTKVIKVGSKYTREVTVAVVLDYVSGNVSAGYSVVHPSDIKNLREGLSKEIAFNRAMLDRTNLLKNETLNIKGEFVGRWLLVSVADQILKQIERGDIIIKGVR